MAKLMTSNAINALIAIITLHLSDLTMKKFGLHLTNERTARRHLEKALKAEPKYQIPPTLN